MLIQSLTTRARFIHDVGSYKKSNFAIPTAATAMPLKPNTAAMIAILKKMAAQVNMMFFLL